MTIQRLQTVAGTSRKDAENAITRMNEKLGTDFVVDDYLRWEKGGETSRDKQFSLACQQFVGGPWMKLAAYTSVLLLFVRSLFKRQS